MGGGLNNQKDTGEVALVDMGLWYRSRPLLPVAWGMLAGAGAGVAWPSPVVAAAGFAAAALAAATWLRSCRALAAGAIAAAGLALAGASIRTAPYQGAAAHDGRIVAVRGVVSGAPEASTSGSSASVRIERIQAADVGGLSGRAYLPPDADAGFDVGDEFVGVGRLRVRGAGVSISLREARRIGRRPMPVTAALEAVRGRLVGALRAALEGSPEREWAVGATLGLRGGIDETDRAAFRRSGAAHLLALSGLNVGGVAAAAYAVAAALRIRRRARAAAAIAAVVAFAAVTGASPSVVRAAVMAVAFLAAEILGRRADPLHALAAAAAATLTVDPLAVADVGFQLSYAAAFALVLAAPAAPGGAVGRLVAASLAAQAATAPITALHFGQVSLVGVVSNIVLVPLFGAVVPAGLTVAIAGAVAPAAGAALGPLLGLLLSAARVAVEAFAAVPGAAVNVPAPSAATVVLWIAALVAAPRAIADGHAGRAARVLLAAALLLLALRGGASYASIDDGRLRAVCLDGAALLHRRDGGRVLVLGDAPSGEVVGPLARRGLNRLDLLVLGVRAERARALEDVLGAFDVRRIALRPPDPGPRASALAAFVRARGVPVEALPVGRRAGASAGGLVTALAAGEEEVAVAAAEGARSILLGLAPDAPPVEVACGGVGTVRTLYPGDEAIVDAPGAPWRFGPSRR